MVCLMLQCILALNLPQVVVVLLVKLFIIVGRKLNKLCVLPITVLKELLILRLVIALLTALAKMLPVRQNMDIKVCLNLFSKRSTKIIGC